jgi:hypothetical protein
VGEARYVPKNILQMTTVPDYWSYRYGYAVKGSQRNVSHGAALLKGSTLTGVFTDTYLWRYGVILDIVIVTHFLSLPLADGRYANPLIEIGRTVIIMKSRSSPNYFMYQILCGELRSLIVAMRSHKTISASDAIYTWV